MDPKQQLLTQINQQVTQAGLAFEVYAIGPAGVPIPAKALMPAGFQLIVNLVPGANVQSNGNGTIYEKLRATGNGADAGSD